LQIFDEYRARRIAADLATALDGEQTVLDCGCGRMEIAQQLHAMLGTDVVGLDLISVNQTSLPLCLGNGIQLPFADQSFDAVYVALVLHHSRQPEHVLAECLRVTRRLLVVLEDVYNNSLERSLLKILDWLGNRSISPDINFPYNFKKEAEWLHIFHKLGVRLQRAQAIRPVPWRPSRHRMFVLEKINDQATLPLSALVEPSQHLA
jgi:ubiquinone/menaquinone biosynthesis C-methylase UbiE